jgi:hypothetical protein
MDLADLRNFHQIQIQELRFTLNSEAPALTNPVVDSSIFSSTLHFEVMSMSKRCGWRWGEHMSIVTVDLGADTERG